MTDIRWFACSTCESAAQAGLSNNTPNIAAQSAIDGGGKRKFRSVVPEHMPADLLRVGALGGHLVGDPAFVHHDDTIREFEDFVQVL